MNTKTREKRKPNKIEAFSTLIFLIVTILLFSIKGGASVGTPLALSIAYTAFIAYRCGYTWDDIKTAMGDKVHSIIDIFFILLGVGFLIATWMFSGTVPTMISYMIRVVSPKFVVVLTFILCGILSMIIGTGWGTAGTLGIVMIGLGQTLGANLPAMAAAVAGGSHIGQVLSPMADMVNLTAGLAKKDPFETVKRSAYIMAPAIVAAIVVYTIIGFSFSSSTATDEQINAVINSISSIFNVNIIALIPFVLLLVLAAMKKPIVPVLFASGLSAILIGVILNHFSLSAGINIAHAGFTLKAVGIDAAALDPIVVSLVQRGGMSSFASVFVTLFLAMGYAGVMIMLGALEVIVNTLFGKAKNPVALSISTVLIGMISAASTSNSYLTLLMPVELMGPKYEEQGWDISNAACVSGSVGALFMLLLPWTTTAIYFAGVTGVPTIQALPYQVFVYGCPIFAVLTSILKFGWTKKSDEA